MQDLVQHRIRAAVHRKRGAANRKAQVWIGGRVGDKAATVDLHGFAAANRAQFDPQGALAPGQAAGFKVDHGVFGRRKGDDVRDLALPRAARKALIDQDFNLTGPAQGKGKAAQTAGGVQRLQPEDVERGGKPDRRAGLDQNAIVERADENLAPGAVKHGGFGADAGLGQRKRLQGQPGGDVLGGQTGGLGLGWIGMQGSPRLVGRLWRAAWPTTAKIARKMRRLACGVKAVRGAGHAYLRRGHLWRGWWPAAAIAGSCSGWRAMRRTSVRVRVRWWRSASPTASRSRAM